MDQQLQEDLDAWFRAQSDPCLIIDADRKVLLASMTAEQAASQGLVAVLPSGRVEFAAVSAAREFELLVDHMNNGGPDFAAMVLCESRRDWRLLELRRLRATPDLRIAVRFGPRTSCGLDLEPIARHYGLSGMEQKVVSALVDGVPTKVLAQQLAISPHTVRTHLRSAYHKLNVQTQLEAQRIALTLGIRKVDNDANSIRNPT